MGLAVSTEEVQEFTLLLVQAGVTKLEMKWRGLEVVYSEGREDAAVEALKLIKERLKSLPSYESRKAFIEHISERAREKALEEDKETKPNVH